MNLIDILNQILATKNELRDIPELQVNNNFSRFPTAIHNLLAQEYNRGYAQGYHDKLYELTEVESWPENQKNQAEEYPNEQAYSGDTYEILYNIMKDVLGYRVAIRDEMELQTDYFPSYPEYLRRLLLTVYDTAYEAGEEAGEEAVVPSEPIDPPTISYSDNTITITHTDENVRIYFMIGSNKSASIRYSTPLLISDNVNIYAYAKKSNSKSTLVYQSCTYSPSGTKPNSQSMVYAPTVEVDNSNHVYISPLNSGDTIYYATEGREYKLYTGPFEITEDTQVTVYAVRDGVISSTETSTVLYTAPGDTQIQTCKFPVYSQNDNNNITLSCDTTGATIYYKLGISGSYNTYNGAFSINENVDLYCYAAKSGYNNSTVRRYPLTYIVTVVKPETPIIYYVDDKISAEVHIWTTTAVASIVYKIGYTGAWQTVQYNHANVLPGSDCVIYAYADLGNDNVSDVAVFNVDWYSKINDLPAPSLNMINNRVYVTVDEDLAGETAIYFTTDGSSPKSGQMYSEAYNRSNIVIAEDNTIVRVIMYKREDDGLIHWSNEANGVFSPSFDEESWDYEQDFFNVTGASAIYLSGVPAVAGNVMNWSYDKINWTPFKDSVTGLDKTKTVYLKTYSYNGRVWDSMSFAEGDEVTIAGNLMSTIWADSYTEHTTFDSDRHNFRRAFYNCKQLVNAKNLVMNVTNTFGNDYSEMFAGCSNLTIAPKDPFAFKQLGYHSCYRMFKDCINLVTGPKFEFTDLGEGACEEMFMNCPKLYSTGSFILNSIGDYGLMNAFNGCTSIPIIKCIINGNLGYESCYQTFMNCKALDAIQKYSTVTSISLIDIRSEEIGDSSCLSMFEGCTSLTGFPKLPAEQAKAYCYKNMFKGCENLTDMQGIGLTTCGTIRCKQAMMSMFEGCTSLKTAPTISIFDIKNQDEIMYRMFYGCSQLNYIKALFLTDPMLQGGGKTYWPYTLNWVYGVAEKGTFVQDDDAEWFRTGVSAIPESWTTAASANAAGHIREITCHYDKVTIKASNDNAIYYQINSQDGEWILYTGPFYITTDCTVYAKCLTNRGTWGPVESQWVEVEVPLINASVDNGVVSLYWPDDYDYSTVYYALYVFGTGGLIQDWTTYDGPFNITNDISIHTKGLKPNGTMGPINYINLRYSVGAPVVYCTNNIVRIRQDGAYTEISYKINDAQTYSTYNEPFVINENCTITTYSRYLNPADGRYYNSEVASYDCIYNASGASYVLHIPVFKHKNNDDNNIIVCSYAGNELRIPNNIHVRYRVNNGTWKEWVFNGSYSSQIVLSESLSHVSIETYAYDDNQVQSDHRTYEFDYNSSKPSNSIVAPSIVTLYDGKNVSVYINSNTQGVQNFYKILAQNEEEAGLFGNQLVTEWTPVNDGGGKMLYNVPSFIVYAYSIDQYGFTSSITHENCSGTRNGVNISKPSIKFNAESGWTTITGSYTTYYSLDNINYSVYRNGFYVTENTWVYAYSMDTTYGHKSGTTSKWCELKPVVVEATCANNVITVTANREGATIYYSTTSESGPFTTYSSPIIISDDTEIWIYGVWNGNTSDTKYYLFEYEEPYTFSMNFDTATNVITASELVEFKYFLRKNTLGEINSKPQLQAQWANRYNDPPNPNTVWDTSYTYSYLGDTLQLNLTDEHTAAYVTAYTSHGSYTTQVYRNPIPEIIQSYQTVVVDEGYSSQHTEYWPGIKSDNWIVPAWTNAIGYSNTSYNSDVFYMWRISNNSYTSAWETAYYKTGDCIFRWNDQPNAGRRNNYYNGYTFTAYSKTAWSPYYLSYNRYRNGYYDWFTIDNQPPHVALTSGVLEYSDMMFDKNSTPVSYEINFWTPDDIQISYSADSNSGGVTFTYTNMNTPVNFSLARHLPNETWRDNYSYRSNGTWQHRDTLPVGGLWVELGNVHSLPLELGYHYSVRAYGGIPTVETVTEFDI